MSNIYVKTLQADDQIPVFVPSQGDTQRATVQQLADFVQKSYTDSCTQLQVSQFAVVVAGSAVQISEPNTFLILTATTKAQTLAVTVSMPLFPVDGCVVSVVTDLTQINVTWATGTFVGAPTAITPTTPATLKYSLPDNTWYYA